MEPFFSAQVFSGTGVQILSARRAVAAIASGTQSRKD